MLKTKTKSKIEAEKLYKVPEVEQVISDHAGTVLGEDEPEPHLKEDEETAARQVFTQYDKDRSGALDKAEMKAMLKELELTLDAAAWEKFADSAWGEADVDDNGRISMDEFLLFYARVYAPAFKCVRARAPLGSFAFPVEGARRHRGPSR